MIDEFDLTFVLVIHEIKVNDFKKGIGHVGSQFTRKATTIISIEEINKNLFKLIPFKSRRDERKSPEIFRYCKETKQLVLANEFEKGELKLKKASTNEIAMKLIQFLSNKNEQLFSEIQDHITKELEISKRTFRSRIKNIRENEIIESLGYNLIEGTNGKNKTLKLERI
ncbi:MAG: hypothetical protein JEY94_17260 [Melioribacteraceae bacterium]|nr:hypothetical protein [Melioribacteraceae bacterium]